MKSKILIIGRKDSGDKNSPGIMQQELTGQGEFEVDVVYWEDLVFDISTAETFCSFEGGDFKDYKLIIALGWYQGGDMAIYRDVAFTLALYLNNIGIPFWNGEMAQQRSTTKLSAIMQMALEAIDVPRTLFSLDRGKLLDYAAKNIDFPAVAKAAAASRGRDNYLVDTQAALREILQKSDFNSFTVQPFIQNDHDLRVVCFDGKPQLIIKRSRTSEDTHLNNVSQGGSAQQVGLDEVPKELLTNAEKICKIFAREMAGIDFLPSSQAASHYVCLEVNAIPQLTSGSMVSEKMRRLAQVIEEITRK